MTKVELVTTTIGVGRYAGLTPGQIVEAVARHGALKAYGRLIRYLMGNKHWSPLEHVHFGFRIETSRDISAQMIRHRSFHWQEFSQRYSKVQEFMPVELRRQGETNRQVGDEPLDPRHILVGTDVDGKGYCPADLAIKSFLEHAKSLYNELVREGVAKECARRFLPMASKTVVHMTGNLRDFLGYLNVRCEAGTQKEHRDIALSIGEILEQEFPELTNINWREGGFM